MSLVADYSDSDESSNSNDEEEDTSNSKRNGGDVITKDKEQAPAKFPNRGGACDSNLLVTSTTEESESGSGSSDEEDQGLESETKQHRRQVTLDNPFRTFGDVNVAKEDSVFRNPFREQEEKRIAVLERHVKMTENPETALTINGKKICWNYRKRKCYLGTQCPYAHDSDVLLTEEQLKEQKLESDQQRAAQLQVTPAGNNVAANSNSNAHLPGTASVIAGGYDSSAFFSSPHLGGNNEKRKPDPDSDDASEPYPSKRSKSKKRVGLTNSIIPSKRALDLYNKTKDK